MELERFVAQVTEQLTATAALGDDRTRQIATALASSAEGAVRLATIRAVSATVEQVNRALVEHSAGIALAVRIEDDEPVLHVVPGAAVPPGTTDDLDGEASARISLRLSEALKADIDTAAAAAAVSVNTWLVRAARAALSRGIAQPTTHTGHHIRGWVTG